MQALKDVVKDIQDYVEFKRNTGETFAMFCRNDLININGVQTTLYYQTKLHSRDDLKRAKSAAKGQWDIVRFKVIKLKD